MDNNNNNNSSGSNADEIPRKEEAQCQQQLPTVQISFHLSPEEGSSRLAVHELREEVRDYGQAITRVDTSLATLKNQLMSLRDHDLQLLKQLIQVGDTIRKMSRSHENRHGSRRGNSRAGRATQELMTSAVDYSVTLRRSSKPGGRMRSGSIFNTGAGDYSTVPLLRRQSEPQVCTTLTAPRRADLSGDDLRSWGSRRGSGSSIDWWSEDTLGSSEEGLDTYGSDDDLLATIKEPPAPSLTTDGTSTTASTTAAADTTLPCNSITTTAGFSGARASFIGDTTPSTITEDVEEEESVDPTAEKFVLRPKSHSVVAATFLSQPNLSGGNSTYSDILNKNVQLWKDRLENAHSVRHRIAILEEES